MTSLQTRKLTYAALFLALALVLPFLTAQIPEIGSMLSPMHIPVLLCGFGMPAMFPGAAAMAFELATYGAVSGLLYRMLPRKKWSIYATLITAMIVGRVVWGIARWILAGLSGKGFTWAMFLAGGFTNAVPGIILHIVLIPVLVMVLDRAGLSLNRQGRK